MSAPRKEALPPQRVELTPLLPGSDRRVWLWVAAATAVGATLIVMGYSAWRSRLPSQIPTHYAVSGRPDGWMTPPQFLLTGLVTELILGGTLTVVAALLLRSPLVSRLSGRAGSGLLIGWGSLVVTVSVPGTWLAQLAAGADLGPSWATGNWGSLWFGTVVPAVGLLGWAVAYRRTLRRGLAGTESHAAGVRPLAGARYRLQCSACGEGFSLGEVPVWTPHLPAAPGEGARALLYTRCPRCGERGWNLSFGPDGPASAG